MTQIISNSTENIRLSGVWRASSGSTTMARAAAIASLGACLTAQATEPITRQAREPVTKIDLSFGGVYVAKKDSTMSATAMQMRRSALRLMGMDDEEIAEFCDASRFPANLEEELEDLEAMRRIQIRNARIDSQ